MAFDHYPPSIGTDVQSYKWLTQMVKSLDEATSAALNHFHPPTTKLWDGNTIPPGGLTTTTLTDTTKQWANDQGIGIGGWLKRYFSWPDPYADFDPVTYEVVLLKLFGGGEWDWRNMLSLPITGQNWIDNGVGADPRFTSNQLIFSAIDTDTPYFPGLDYYTDYFIQRENGAFPHKRVPEWPNDLTLEWAIATATTTTSLTVPRDARRWTIDQWKNKWLYYTVGFKTRSVLITGNDRDNDGNHVIHFAAIPTAPDTLVFGILAADGKYWKEDHQPIIDTEHQGNTLPMPIRAWIRMGEAHNDLFYTHSPDDQAGVGHDKIVLMRFPSAAFTITDTDPIDPVDRVVNTVNPSTPYLWGTDADIFNLPGDTHSPYDWCFTMPHHKTLRSWHQRIWELCQYFIPYRADFYQGYDRFWINNMSVPVLMWEAQVCAAHGTTGMMVSPGVIAADLSFSEDIPVELLPIIGRATIEKIEAWDNPAGTYIDLGLEKHDTGEIVRKDIPVTWDGTNLIGDFTGDCQLQDIWFTWGMTRLIPDRLRYLRDKTCFQPDPIPPDPDPEAEPPPDAPQLPPTEDAPGTWATRPKSRQFIDYDDYGKLADPFSGTENGGTNFETGKLGRYVGDNFDDPTTSYSVQSPRPWEVEYDDHFYEGNPSTPSSRPRNFDVLAAGAITGIDDDLQFSDDSLHLWADILIGNGGESTHVITPTSLSTTSMSDTSHAGSAFWDGTHGRWAGHWFMIWQPGDIDSGGTAGPLHKTMRPVSAYTAATQTLDFPAIAGLTSIYSYQDSGGGMHTGTTTARIIEPKWELNKLKSGTCLLIRSDDGTVIYGKVEFSADRHVRVVGWKDSDDEDDPDTVANNVTYTPVIGDTFLVRTWATGVILKWNGLKFVRPTGIDARGEKVFPDALWTIPPTYRKRYGRLMNGDYISRKYHTEIHKMRATLRMRVDIVCFAPDADGSSTTDNNAQWFRGSGNDGCPPEAPGIAISFSGYTCNPIAQSNSNNVCTIQGFRSCGYAQLDIGAGALGSFTDPHLRIGARGKWLAYAGIDEEDHDDGEVVNLGGGPRFTTYNFDANGDAVVFHQWNIFDGISNSTDLHRTSSQFGSLDEPNPASPLTETTGEVRGYFVKRAVAVTDYGENMIYI